MIFHSKVWFMDLCYVSEIYREDWTFIGKKSWRDDKFLAIVNSIEFVNADKVEELYTIFRVVVKWDKYISDEWSFLFIPEERKYPVNFVIKVEDVINSYWDKEEFNFLSESRNERRWVNPDKSIAKYFKWKKEEVVNVYNYYKRFLKKRDI